MKVVFQPTVTRAKRRGAIKPPLPPQKIDYREEERRLPSRRRMRNMIRAMNYQKTGRHRGNE